ncbi:MAG: hypothetical protein V1875_03940 [Candidatus Altiarchaeota archaeon]
MQKEFPQQQMQEHAGKSIRDGGALMRLRRRGSTAACKVFLAADMALMAFGQTGCSTEKKVDKPQGQKQEQRFDEKDKGSDVKGPIFDEKGFEVGSAKKKVDSRLKEARKMARRMREDMGQPPSVQGNFTTDEKGDRVSVEDRWKRLMSEEPKIRTDKEVDGWLREVKSLEDAMGPEKVKQLTNQFQQK